MRIIQNLLLEHHGRVADLIVCKGAFTEANELKDEMQTLKGYGIMGAPRGVDPPVMVPLFYDFKPIAYDEPLLLVRSILLVPRAGMTFLGPYIYRYYVFTLHRKGDHYSESDTHTYECNHVPNDVLRAKYTLKAQSLYKGLFTPLTWYFLCCNSSGGTW